YEAGTLAGLPVETLVPMGMRGHHAGLRASFQAHAKERVMGSDRKVFGIRRDGSEVPIEIGLKAIDSRRGRLVIASIVDITQRRLQETALEKSEAQYRPLAEN